MLGAILRFRCFGRSCCGCLRSARPSCRSASAASAAAQQLTTFSAAVGLCELIGSVVLYWTNRTGVEWLSIGFGTGTRIGFQKGL